MILLYKTHNQNQNLSSILYLNIFNNLIPFEVDYLLVDELVNILYIDLLVLMKIFNMLYLHHSTMRLINVYIIKKQSKFNNKLLIPIRLKQLQIGPNSLYLVHLSKNNIIFSKILKMKYYYSVRNGSKVKI